jgi:hypothetical protein
MGSVGHGEDCVEAFHRFTYSKSCGSEPERFVTYDGTLGAVAVRSWTAHLLANWNSRPGRATQPRLGLNGSQQSSCDQSRMHPDASAFLRESIHRTIFVSELARDGQK